MHTNKAARAFSQVDLHSHISYGIDVFGHPFLPYSYRRIGTVDPSLSYIDDMMIHVLFSFLNRLLRLLLLHPPLLHLPHHPLLLQLHDEPVARREQQLVEQESTQHDDGDDDDEQVLLPSHDQWRLEEVEDNESAVVVVAAVVALLVLHSTIHVLLVVDVFYLYEFDVHYDYSP